MIVSFFISKTQPPLAIDTDISIPVSDVVFCRPPGHSLKTVLRCSVFYKTFTPCWFPLYFIYRHFSRIALAIIWCWFFQHSLMQLKVSGVGCQVWKHWTEDWVLRFEVYRNRKGRKWPCQLMTENDPSSLCRASPRQATHGPRRTIHGKNRHFMLKWSAARQAFLLSPQSSALSPYFSWHLKPVWGQLQANCSH